MNHLEGAQSRYFEIARQLLQVSEADGPRSGRFCSSSNKFPPSEGRAQGPPRGDATQTERKKLTLCTYGCMGEWEVKVARPTLPPPVAVPGLRLPGTAGQPRPCEAGK